MALAVLAPVLNWVNTGDHLVRTLGEGYWPVAGIDLLLLAGAVVAVWTARRQHYAAKTWHAGQARDWPARSPSTPFRSAAGSFSS